MIAASDFIATRPADFALALMYGRSRFTHRYPAFQVLEWPQYTIAREVILLRTLSLMLPQLLDIGRHDDGGKLSQDETFRVASTREASYGEGIGRSCVAIADVSSEELDETAGGVNARVGEQ